MELEYHPSVQKDIRDALAYFDRFSDAVGDKVFKDFRSRVEDVRLSPLRFPPFEGIFRKAPLKQYPFDVVYRIVGKRVKILVFRHQERHPNYGLRSRAEITSLFDPVHAWSRDAYSIPRKYS